MRFNEDYILGGRTKGVLRDQPEKRARTRATAGVKTAVGSGRDVVLRVGVDEGQGGNLDSC